ncbi:S9 family peptidase, partial [Novosphingobium sp. NRRL B-2648]
MNRARLLSACILAALPSAALPAFAAPAERSASAMPETVQDLTFDRVFASPSLDGPQPRAVKVSPDGRYITLLRGRAEDKDRYDLWAYDRRNGEWRMLVDSLKLGSGRALSEAEKMQRERQRVGSLKGIISYEWTEGGDAVLVPLDGDLYLAGIDGS